MLKFPSYRSSSSTMDHFDELDPIFGKNVISFSTNISQGPSPNSTILPRLSHESTTSSTTRRHTTRCALADPHLSPRMTSPVVELLRRDKYTLGVGHEAFSNGRTKLPLVNNNHRRVSLSRIVRSARSFARNERN